MKRPKGSPLGKTARILKKLRDLVSRKPKPTVSLGRARPKSGGWKLTVNRSGQRVRVEIFALAGGKKPLTAAELKSKLGRVLGKDRYMHKQLVRELQLSWNKYFWRENMEKTTGKQLPRKLPVDALSQLYSLNRVAIEPPGDYDHGPKGFKGGVLVEYKRGKKTKDNAWFYSALPSWWEFFFTWDLTPDGNQAVW